MKTSVRLFVLVLSAISVAAGPAAAQASQGSVTGSVTNSLSGAVVPNATVVLESPTGNKEIKTGNDGKFSIANVTPGTYHLSIRADGYMPLRTELVVAATGATTEIKLPPELHFTEVTSVSPDARNQIDSYQPTSVLGGQDLAASLQGTIGATLNNQPGVATRSFGPGPARPVIRGLDGDRVLVLEDGQRMGDLSSQSGDHGVNVNPAGATKIEVVRGPATLLYGANAIGGLVNVITRNIPTEPVHGVMGTATFDLGSAAAEGGGAGDVSVGNGSVALHVSGSGRRSGNYASPDGDIANSFNRAGYFEVGFAKTSANGYFGVSGGYDRTHYGIPLVEAGETNIDPRRKLFDIRAERRNLDGPFSAVRFSVGVRRYNHDELDGDEIATSFTNNTTEFEFLGHHHDVKRLKGSIGASFLTRTFSAEGEEVLSPEVDQDGFAVFLYEEVAASPHVTIQFGGRYDHAGFTPAEEFSDRTFNNFSGSVGLLLHPSEQTTVAFSLARAARNPALEELYFHGPHGGNNVVENGDDTLESEHALGFDGSFRWQAQRTSGEMTIFANQISNFVFRQLTGEVDELPVSFFTQGDASLYGFESHIDLRVTNMLWIEGGFDTVHGTLTTDDTPMPRIPPSRGLFGVRLKRNAFDAGVQGSFTAAQDRIFQVNGVGETPTDGYNLAKLFAAYTFTHAGTLHTFAIRLENAGNALYHNHLNYLKDLAPEMGRDFRVTYTVKF